MEGECGRWPCLGWGRSAVCWLARCGGLIPRSELMNASGLREPNASQKVLQVRGGVNRAVSDEDIQVGLFARGAVVALPAEQSLAILLQAGELIRSLTQVVVTSMLTPVLEERRFDAHTNV